MCPFFDNDLMYLKRAKRKQERNFRKTCSVDDRAKFRDATEQGNRMLHTKKKQFIEKTLASRNTKKKFSLLKLILGTDERVLPTTSGDD